MLAHTQFGTHGNPVILIHGLLGSRYNMSMIARSLSHRFKVYAVDLRNHGESPYFETMTHREMARDLSEFMDGMGIKTAALMGHSLGGKCAMQFALDYPDRCTSLTVADIAPKTYQPIWEGYVTAMQDLDLDGVEKRVQADQALAKVIPARAYRQFLLQNLERVNDRVKTRKTFVWKCNLKTILNEKDNICASVEGASYSGPTLFIRGGNSTFVADEDESAIRSLFPASELKIIPNAGHLIHFEARESFTELYTAFLCANQSQRETV